MPGTEPVSLRSTRAELAAAEDAIHRMKIAATFGSFRQAWEDFLNRLAKLWIKAERECQRVRNQFEPWQGRYKRELRRDPLLAYVFHARNADQHTIQPIAAVAIDIQATLQIGSTAEVEVNHLTGRISIRGELIDPNVSKPKYVLLPVRDGGEDFPVPTQHLGAVILENDPLSVAQLALAFFKDFVEKASARFEQPDCR